MGVGAEGHSGRMKSAGEDERESEKEMESRRDTLFPFGSFAGTARTEESSEWWVRAQGLHTDDLRTNPGRSTSQHCDFEQFT